MVNFLCECENSPCFSAKTFCKWVKWPIYNLLYMTQYCQKIIPISYVKIKRPYTGFGLVNGQGGNGGGAPHPPRPTH